MVHSLDPGDDRVVSDTDVFIHVDRVRLLAELRVVVVIVQYIHVDSCAEEQNRDKYHLLQIGPLIFNAVTVN